MKRIAIDAIEPELSWSEVDRRELTTPLGMTDMAISRYRLDPGERLGGLHAHLDQEEVFVVIGEVATLETLDGEVVVGTDEAVRFAPGEFQSGKNDSEGELVLYALGAPREPDDLRIPLSCPACGHDDRRPGVMDDGETPALVCPDCGTETEATCSACGSDQLYATIDEDCEGPVGVCGETVEGS